MAKVIGQPIKPDWSVVRYETEGDFEYLHKTFDDWRAKTGIYELCKGLQNYDEEFNPKQTFSLIMILINANNSQVKIRMYPFITDTEMEDLSKLVSKINKRFINDEWHTFPSYEKMVKRVAKDYDEWLQYAGEKEAWDAEELWSSTDAGYKLVFPIWRYV